MRLVVVLAAISLASPADADPAADANKALQAFVDAAAAKKLPEEIDAFITPGHDAENEIGDLDDLATIVAKPTLKILSTHLAKSGTAAWIVGEIGGAKYIAHIGDKPSTTLRASAFLTLDGGVWHVRAAHWSGEKRDQKLGEGCGMLDSAYDPPAHIGKGAEPAVQVIKDAFLGEEYRSGKLIKVPLLAALSSSKDAQMFGSAPKERWTGGAAIQKVFKRWNVDLRAQIDKVRAGIAPGGDLAWVATEVDTDTLCSSYRAFFVLEKEGTAWKIVHAHFSGWVMTP